MGNKLSVFGENQMEFIIYSYELLELGQSVIAKHYWDIALF